MRRTNIYLDEAQTASLDRLATQEGVSRAEVIRRLLDHALSGSADDPASDLAAINDSFAALPDLGIPGRLPADRDEHLTRVWRGTE